MSAGSAAGTTSASSPITATGGLPSDEGAGSGSVGASSSGGAEGDLHYTYQRVECYLAEPAAECAPPTETLLPLLRDVIYGGYGYVPSNVAAFARSYEFPSSCEPLLTECCDALADNFKRAHCYDLIDVQPPDSGFEPGCPPLAAELKEFDYCAANFQVEAAGEGRAGAGGQPAGSDGLAARSLCCYMTSGMSQLH